MNVLTRQRINHNFKKLTPLKILMQEKNHANRRCRQSAQTFQNRMFLDVKRTNNYFLAAALGVD